MSGLDDLLGESSAIVALRQKVRALAQHLRDARRPPPILVQGETGTGKGLLARLMHQTGSRGNGPFIDLNCAAIPETLLEAELFGYERGAFTDARQSKPGLFHVASGGTLFLDEVGLLPRGLQAKLLTVLEQGSVRRLGATRSEAVDVAIIAATNEPLLASVREGRFREDLYHRLAVLTIELPPLRERGHDVELLAERILARVCSEYKLPPKSLSRDARAALTGYTWPGNVRELSNVIERAALLCDTNTVSAEDLDLPRDPPRGVRVSPGRRPLEEERRQRLVTALEETAWNITRTAAALGITRNTVRAWMGQYGLRPSRADEPSPPARAPADAALSDTIDAGPADTSVRPTAAGVRWERRRITFLRARILWGVDADPSSTRRALGWFIEKVQSFGGRVIEVGQQNVLAVFGHEPAEDAPRRAANVAIATTKAVEREHTAGTLPTALSVAAAIHVEQAELARIGSGPVIDRDAVSRAVSILDALEPVAGGEVAVSDPSLGFLARHFDIRRPPAHALGQRLAGLLAITDRARMAAFIGRQTEIDLLQAVVDRAMLGRGQIVSVVGEAGIGKSRLVHEFQRSAVEQGAVMLEGRCAPYGIHVPYFPVIDILQAACLIEEADPVETVDAKVLAALRRLGDSAVAAAPYLQYLLVPRKVPELDRLSAAAIKAKTFEALRQVVLAEAAHRTLVLLVEDLQWIDQTSKELLGSVAEVLRGARVVLITTSRPGSPMPWMGQTNVTQIAVGPLSVAESRRLVESVLPEHGAPEGLTTSILARADGNPFFLEELAWAARERQDDTSLAVPGTVHDVIAARIDGLAETDRHVLDLAAVIGRDVSVSLLHEASGLARDDLQASVGRLQSSGFLVATRSGSDTEYTFKHALTHEVADGSVPATTRAALHGRVAAAIETVAPEIGARRPEVIARHYAGAGRQTEAIDHWCRAGQLAIQRSAHGDAIVLLTEGLTLLAKQPPGPARTAREVMAQLAMATCLTATRSYGAPELEGTLARIRTLADQLTEPAQQFNVRWSVWRFYLSRADFRAAEELAPQLLAMAERQDDAVVRVGAYVASGVDKFYLGDFSGAQAFLARALDLYDRDQTAVQILTYGQDMGVAASGFHGWAQAVTGDLEGAAARADQTLRLARVLRHPFSLALALFLAGEIHALRRDTAAVRSLAEELVGLSREHSFSFFCALGLMFSGWSRVLGGDIRDGLALMQEGAALFRSVGQLLGLAHRARLAEALLLSGAVEEALAATADALDRWRQTAEQAFVAAHLRIRGDALVATGDTEGARRAFREAVDFAGRQGAWLFALRAATGLARLDPGTLDVLRTITDHFPATLESSDLRTARALLKGAP